MHGQGKDGDLPSNALLDLCYTILSVEGLVG